MIVPTLNAARTLNGTLAPLVRPTMDGLVSEVIVTDGGSMDATCALAEEAGAKVIVGEKGRGGQLARGAAAAKRDWLLFLHADTRLKAGWAATVADFMASASGPDGKAAAFRFRLDDMSLAARFVEWSVVFRCWAFRLPYGDQGLLISRALYDAVGGFRPLPLMEDVDLVRRLGRRRVRILSADAVTSAQRYLADGYLKRIVRNARCLSLYYRGVSPDRILQIYERRS